MIKFYRICLLVLILFPFCSFAQSVQSVVVLEYRGEKTKRPLANVEVVVQNAASSVTAKDGTCTLSFRTLKPGDKINIRRIYKQGYELFNIDESKQWYISRNNEPITILLIESQRLTKIQNEYRTSTEKTASRQFENETIKLNKQYVDKGITEEEYNKKLRELKDEYERRLDNIDNYIDQFAHIDLSKLNKAEIKIGKLLKSGDIDAAIAEYEKINLVGEYKKNTKAFDQLDNDISKVNAALERSTRRRAELLDAARRQVILLNFAGGEENSQKANYLLYDIAKVDTTNYPFLLWAGERLRKVNNYSRAEDLLNYCLNSNDPIISIEANIILGALDTSRGLYSPGFQKILKSHNELERIVKERNDSTYLLEWQALALKEIMRSQIRLADTAAINRFQGKALDVARLNLVLSPTSDNKRNLIETLTHISDCYRVRSNYDEAYRYVQEALNLQIELYREEPNRQVGMLAYIYGRIGSIFLNHKTEGHYEECIEAFEKSVEYYKKAMTINPIAYRKNYSQALGNCGTAYIVSGIDYIKGIELNNKALEAFIETAGEIDVYTSTFYNNSIRVRALAYFQLGQIEKAKELLDGNISNAIRMYEKDKIANRSYIYQYYNLYYKYYAHPSVNNMEKADEYILKALEVSPRSADMQIRAKERGLK